MEIDEAAKLIDERCDAVTGAIAALGQDAKLIEQRAAFMRAARAAFMRAARANLSDLQD